MARPWARTSRADFTWAMVVGWMEHKARLGWPMIWYSHSSTIHLYIIPGSFKKSSHGTWQASNLRSPLQPPLQSCNWKGLNVPNLNGCFFWRPTATTRKKQLWSWGARGIPRLNLLFYRMVFFNEEPGIIVILYAAWENEQFQLEDGAWKIHVETLGVVFTREMFWNLSKFIACEKMYPSKYMVRSLGN